MSKPMPEVWSCKPENTADPPQDCGWPTCGCDPNADKVIAALDESGIVLLPRERLSVVFALALAGVPSNTGEHAYSDVEVEGALDACRAALGETER